MPKTMKAAVVTAFGKPLEFREVEVPTPGAGQVLVKIAASGVCHTDLHAAQGDWPVKPNPPFIPGHEGVGHVVAVGCIPPAVIASTAWAAGKPSANPSRTPATR